MVVFHRKIEFQRIFLVEGEAIYQLVKKFLANEAGRDFVCADVHGHFSLLSDILSEVNFDSSLDRLFSLGDLIDRGGESFDVLRWLNQPWFFAIQGNHERMLINAMDLGELHMFHQWYMWGGDWAENLSIEELEPFYDAFSKLPIAIEIETKFNGKIALVHAELPNECDWIEIREILEKSNLSILPTIFV